MGRGLLRLLRSAILRWYAKGGRNLGAGEGQACSKPFLLVMRGAPGGGGGGEILEEAAPFYRQAQPMSYPNPKAEGRGLA